MSELSKSYDPKVVEEALYSFWEENCFFYANSNSPKPAYSISIPPPNVTGVLHMGHALVDTLQDILIRWKRMSGFETLWVPGTDHAGIATQTVVERNLIAKTGKRRKDFSREEFLSFVWQWKEQSEKQILNQLKKLGCSCDWSRLAFTMDEKRNRAVRTIFKKMFDSNLIYRGDYLVNWDPVTQTALADDEVEYEEKNGYLWHFRYPLEDGSGYLTIATTRPETMLGDTAVAVSSSDERYRSFVGKKLRHPFTDRLIPVITDPFVDSAFGSGAVKITPAHDPNDYQIALRHNLSMINIMTPDGKINENGKEFTGMTMAEARFEIIKRMKELELVEKIEPHTHRVGISYRSKAIIEPFLSKQWFVKMSGFKEQLISAVKEKRVRLIPEQWENTYFHWIDNLRDWCISRQLWWGHQIPIWYHKDTCEKMICYDGIGTPPEVKADPASWVQDEDVLDTWFSSALWPFSILGWPDQTDDLKKFYPNSTLVTGHDILFFWVARMILFGEYALEKAPFKETFIHGLIYGKSYWRFNEKGVLFYVSAKERIDYDLGKLTPQEVQSKWEKMSKSKGNVIDPIEIIDIYGTDAMRMTLAASATSSRQIDLDRRRFEEFKNFANKIWNGARFVLMNTESLTAEELCEGFDSSSLSLEDRWILSLLNRTTQNVNKHLEDYAFDRAALLAYEFFWKQFCAYYVELTKPTLFGKSGSLKDQKTKQKLLIILLCNSIRLLHPLTPFITEELFQHLKRRYSHLELRKEADIYTQETIVALQAKACIVSSYPKLICEKDIDQSIEAAFGFMEELVYAIRNIRAEMQLPPSSPINLFIIGNLHEKQIETIQKNETILRALVRLDKVSYSSEEPFIKFFASALVDTIKLIIPLPDELREKEKLRLLKDKEKLIQQQNQLRIQLGNEEFVKKAPKDLVAKIGSNLHQLEKELLEIIQKLQNFE